MAVGRQFNSIDMFRSKKKKQKPIISFENDQILQSLGLEARKMLEEIDSQKIKKILYFPSYYQSKFTMVIDATFTLALQARGVEVIPVLTGFFYKKEDAIYGGHYGNSDRFSSLAEYSKRESELFTSLLNTPAIFLSAFLDEEIEAEAKKKAALANFENAKNLFYHNINIGEIAEKVVANMNNMPAMPNEEIYIEQFRWHVYNVVRLFHCTQKIFQTIKPSAAISNCPFYYKWGIPYENARLLNVSWYSYMISERENTMFWSSDTNKILDSSPCWKSFKAANLYDSYPDLIEKAIEKRTKGQISHVKFAPKANQNSVRINEIVKRIDGRPALLFAGNVLVDASVLVKSDAFDACFDMVAKTIEYFQNHPEYVCILKAHPAEKVVAGSGTDVEKMYLKNVIASHNITLPENIIFIDCEEKVSSFDLYPLVKGMAAYTSSTTMEAGWLGLRTINALSSHYSCAEFVKIPKSSEEYKQQLTQILSKEDSPEAKQDMMRNSKTYYLLYYFFAMVDLKIIQGNEIDAVEAKILYSSMADLLPGKNLALDYICDSIINGKPIFGENRWPPITN